MAELAQETKAPRRRGKLGRMLVLTGIVVVLAVSGFYLWRYLNGYESTDDAEVDGHINAVSTRISGNVIQVLAEDEQVVKAVIALNIALAAALNAIGDIAPRKQRGGEANERYERQD